MQCERILYHILRLSQARALFSVSDTIYLRWLELVHSYEILDKVISFIGLGLGQLAKDPQNASSGTLLKLFPRNSDHRTTTLVISTTGEFLERSAGLETDPWRVITNIIHESESGLVKGLNWLNLLSRSGIDVPLAVYGQFTAALDANGNPLEEACLFIKTILASLWLQSLGRQRYQPLLAHFHLSLVAAIHNALQDATTRPTACAFFEYFQTIMISDP